MNTPPREEQQPNLILTNTPTGVARGDVSDYELEMIGRFDLAAINLRKTNKSMYKRHFFCKDGGDILQSSPIRADLPLTPEYRRDELLQEEHILSQVKPYC